MIPELAGRFSERIDLERQVEEQLLALMSHTGRLNALEEYLRSHANGQRKPEHLYYLAIALARQGEEEAALGALQTILASDPNDQRARVLSYRLLLSLADQQAEKSNWQRVSDLTAQAIRIAPEGANPSVDFARFRAFLPVSHLCAGEREEAARLWEKDLIEHSSDLTIIHNLALLYYWWARSDEKVENPRAVAERWRQAIQYWFVLQQSDAFWSDWSRARSATWGFSISADDLNKLREKIPEEQFVHRFQDHLDRGRQKEVTPMVCAYSGCLTAALVEKRSACSWREAIQFLPPGRAVAPWLKRMEAWRANALKTSKASATWYARFIEKGGATVCSDASQKADCLLDLPGGVGFFNRFGLIARVADMALSLGSIAGTASSVGNLRILFSPDGLGEVLVAIEDRGAFAEASALLNKLPQAVKALVEFTYLKSLALARQAEQLYGHGDSAAALECWREAYELSRRECTDVAFSKQLLDLAGSIQGRAINAAVKEANRLNKKGAVDAAILLLQSWLPLEKDNEIRDHICIHLCDRAGRSIEKKNYDSARKDFQRALELKPGYERAKQGMGTTYNNEGCTKREPDLAITWFEHALKWDPSNYQFKVNLSSALRGKAVDHVNKASGGMVRSAVYTAIELVERAYELVSGELKEGALEVIESLAEKDASFADRFISDVQDEELKRVIRDLAVLYNMRARIRRGF